MQQRVSALRAAEPAGGRAAALQSTQPPTHAARRSCRLRLAACRVCRDDCAGARAGGRGWRDYAQGARVQHACGKALHCSDTLRSVQYFRTPIAVDVKADASPVTAADRAAEAAMRALVAARAPTHAVFGEEGGLSRGTGGAEEYVWVLDPIDGTKSFITGKPLFGTLVSLVHAPSGTPLLGVIDQPVLRERWLGVRGQSTTMNGAPLSTRRCGALRDAYLYSTTPLMFDDATRPAYEALAAAVRIPMFGCDCYAYGARAARAGATA